MPALSHSNYRPAATGRPQITHSAASQLQPDGPGAVPGLVAPPPDRPLAAGSLRGAEAEVLDVRVVLDGVSGALAAQAALLDAPERGLRLRQQALVDAHHAVLQTLAHPPRLPERRMAAVTHSHRDSQPGHNQDGHCNWSVVLPVTICYGVTAYRSETRGPRPVSRRYVPGSSDNEDYD